MHTEHNIAHATFLTRQNVDDFISYMNPRYMFHLDKKTSYAIINAYRTVKRRPPTWIEARNLHCALCTRAKPGRIYNLRQVLGEIASQESKSPRAERGRGARQTGMMRRLGGITHHLITPPSSPKNKE